MITLHIAKKVTHILIFLKKWFFAYFLEVFLKLFLHIQKSMQSNE